MKATRLFFALLFLFGAMVSYSQTVNNIPIKDIDVEYIEIVGKSAKAFSRKLKVNLDFGQENRAFTQVDSQIKDENGNAIEFNSMVDALNFMNQNGFEFVQVYSTDDSENYLMRKKKANGKSSIIEFNSLIMDLNWMYRMGYEFVQAYSSDISESYFMNKKQEQPKGTKNPSN